MNWLAILGVILGLALAEIYRARRRAAKDRLASVAMRKQFFNTGRAWGLFEGMNIVLEMPSPGPGNRIERVICVDAARKINAQLQALTKDDDLPLNVRIPVVTIPEAVGTPDRSLS
jgi:hypothetical protein